MSDAETLAVYAAKADEYAATFTGEDRPQLRAFIAAMPAGGTVLDFGCGTGTSALAMAQADLQVVASDASAQMLALVPEHANITRRLADFDDLDEMSLYDGLYASFSLLHAPRAAFPGHLIAIARALKPGGRLHLAMKLGTGEARDTLGRFYTYYTADQLGEHLAAAGLIWLDAHTGEGPGLAGQIDPYIMIAARRGADA